MLDITIDLETCGLCPTAAVMSVGAVAWKRDGKDTPFFPLPGGKGIDCDYVFSNHVDLRGMFVNGFTFDDATAKWWANQSDDAKFAVLDSDLEDWACQPIERVMQNLFIWIDDVKELTGETGVCLWSQGTDFDIAILRNICYHYDIDMPLDYRNFRDHRTFFMEGAHTICAIAGAEFDPKRAYMLVDELPGESVPHDPIYDCKRSIYSTWQMMNYLRSIKGDRARTIMNKAIREGY